MNPSTCWKMTLRLTFAWGLLCLLSPGGPLNAAEDSFELLPRWKKGEKLRYELVKSRQKWQGRKAILKATSRTDLEIEVLSAGNDSFVLAWTLGEIKLDDPSQAGNPLVQKMTNLFKGYRILLELDDQAGIQRVQNWKELQETSKKLLDTITDELKTAGMDEATLAKVRAEVSSMFSTQEKIEQHVTREAQLFFMALGIEFEGGKPFEFEDKLPNPFGGEPLPSRARFTLKEVDKKRGVANITWTQTVASDDARRIMEKTIKDLTERLGKPIPNADTLKSCSIEDAAEFNLELSSGWISSFTHQRTTKAENSSQTDAIAVTRRRD